LQPHGRQQVAVEPPERQPLLVHAVGAGRRLQLRRFHAQRGDRNPPEPADDQQGDQHERPAPPGRAEQPSPHASPPATTSPGPAMYPWARTVIMASGWSSPEGSFNFARSRATCMSTARVSSPAVPIPQTRPSSSSRDTALSRLATRYFSSAAS